MTTRPFAPAVKALETIAEDSPGPVAELIKQLLSGTLTANAYHQAVADLIELVVPVGFERWDDPRREINSGRKMFVEECVRLGAPEPIPAVCKHCGQEIAGAGVEHEGHLFHDAEHLAAWQERNRAVWNSEAHFHGLPRLAPSPAPEASTAQSVKTLPHDLED